MKKPYVTNYADAERTSQLRMVKDDSKRGREHIPAPSSLQAIADELIRMEVVDYITDSTICEVMKKTKSNRGL